MTADSAYGIKPRGHAPAIARAHTVPPDPLIKRCVGWLDLDLAKEMSIPAYNAALESLLGAGQFSAAEAQAMLFYSQIQEHKNYKQVGIFLSAVYTHVPEKMIVYEDFGLPPFDCFGYGMSGDVLLINRGELGDWCGVSARSPILNFGSMGDNCGSMSRNLFINYGTIGDKFGSMSAGVIMNIGTAGESCGDVSEGVVINMGNTGKDFAGLFGGVAICIKPAPYAGTRGTSYALLGNQVPTAVANYAAEVAVFARDRPQDLIGKYGCGLEIAAKLETLSGVDPRFKEKLMVRVENAMAAQLGKPKESRK
jgi:hypothetical protein